MTKAMDTKTNDWMTSLGYENLMRDRATSEKDVRNWAAFLESLLLGNKVGVKTCDAHQNESADFTDGSQAHIQVRSSWRFNRSDSSLTDIYQVRVWTGKRYIPMDSIEWIEELPREERRAHTAPKREYSLV